MKTMFEFDIYHEKEIEKVEVSTNEKGEEVKTTSKVKTTVPVKLGIKNQQEVYLMKLNCFMELDFQRELRLDY